MATATDLIGSLKSHSVTFQLDDAGGLRVHGASRLTDREKADLKAHKATLLKALAVAPASNTATTDNTALPTPTELPELEPKDRLCYQCQHFARSQYVYPLGLCVEQGNRIQHRTSEPTHFGCGTFEPKEGRS